jgi:hypothetical membrane protein
MTPEPDSITSVPRPRRSWFQRLGSVLFVIFCLELGLFLLIYPWMDSWSDNYFSSLGQGAIGTAWREIWNNGYLRGAVSGLGLLNVWVAVAEALRMFIGNEKPE